MSPADESPPELGNADRAEAKRLEAFSDGVFAIAITLLVLELHFPDTGVGRLRHALALEWRSSLPT